MIVVTDSRTLTHQSDPVQEDICPGSAQQPAASPREAAASAPDTDQNTWLCPSNPAASPHHHSGATSAPPAETSSLLALLLSLPCNLLAWWEQRIYRMCQVSIYHWIRYFILELILCFPFFYKVFSWIKLNYSEKKICFDLCKESSEKERGAVFGSVSSLQSIPRAKRSVGDRREIFRSRPDGSSEDAESQSSKLKWLNFH